MCQRTHSGQCCSELQSDESTLHPCAQAKRKADKDLKDAKQHAEGRLDDVGSHLRKQVRGWSETGLAQRVASWVHVSWTHNWHPQSLLLPPAPACSPHPRTHTFSTVHSCVPRRTR